MLIKINIYFSIFFFKIDFTTLSAPLFFTKLIVSNPLWSIVINYQRRSREFIPGSRAFIICLLDREEKRRKTNVS